LFNIRGDCRRTAARHPRSVNAASANCSAAAAIVFHSAAMFFHKPPYSLAHKSRENLNARSRSGSKSMTPPPRENRRLRLQSSRCTFVFVGVEAKMKQELIRIRAELLSNYEKRINDLHLLLNRAKELAPEAKVEIQMRIKLLQKRKRRLEDRYKEIDDLREEAAQLRELVREIRALLSTSNRKSLIKRKGNHSH
jgi:hypothetical protein